MFVRIIIFIFFCFLKLNARSKIDLYQVFNKQYLPDFLKTAVVMRPPEFISNSYRKNDKQYYQVYSKKKYRIEFSYEIENLNVINKKYIILTNGGTKKIHFDYVEIFPYYFKITEEQKKLLNMWGDKVSLQTYKSFINSLTKEQRIKWEFSIYLKWLKVNLHSYEYVFKPTKEIIKNHEQIILKEIKKIVKNNWHFNQEKRNEIYLQLRNMIKKEILKKSNNISLYPLWE